MMQGILCGLTSSLPCALQEVEGIREWKGGKQNNLRAVACSDGVSCQSSVLDRSMKAKASEFLASLTLIKPHWECENSSYNWHSCFCKVGRITNCLGHEMRYQYVSRRK